jgi:hypothetical protein
MQWDVLAPPDAVVVEARNIGQLRKAVNKNGNKIIIN